MDVVLSLGGSLLINEGFSASTVGKYATVIKQIVSLGHRVFVVVGGGKFAREYQRVGADLGLAHEDLDLLGVSVTHTNALLLSLAMNANKVMPRSKEELEKLVRKENLFVCGGTIPGQSTDAVAAQIAALIKADLLINASNVDGVYDKDPKKHTNAKRFASLTYGQLESIIARHDESPGNYPLFDRRAVQTIKKYGIKTVMIDGRRAETILDAVRGKQIGTVIHG